MTDILIIRFNPKKNSKLSDFTVMYTTANNSIYENVEGSIVWIVGSGELSGIFLAGGSISNALRIKMEDSELNRFSKEEKHKWKGKYAWKFDIDILTRDDCDLKEKGYWKELKFFVSPRFLTLRKIRIS